MNMILCYLSTEMYKEFFVYLLFIKNPTLVYLFILLVDFSISFEKLKHFFALFFVFEKNILDKQTFYIDMEQ